MQIDGDLPENHRPVQELDGAELIHVELIPVNDLLITLQSMEILFITIICYCYYYIFQNMNKF